MKPEKIDGLTTGEKWLFGSLFIWCGMTLLVWGLMIAALVKYLMG